MHIQEWRKSTTRYKTIKKQHSNTHTQTESVSDTHKHGELIYTKEQVAHTQLTIQQPSLNTRLICNNSWIIVWQPKGRRWYTEVRRRGGGWGVNEIMQYRKDLISSGFGETECVQWDVKMWRQLWNGLLYARKFDGIVLFVVNMNIMEKSRFFRSVFFCSKQISVCLTNST